MPSMRQSGRQLVDSRVARYVPSTLVRLPSAPAQSVQYDLQLTHAPEVPWWKPHRQRQRQRPPRTRQFFRHAGLCTALNTVTNHRSSISVQPAMRWFSSLLRLALLASGALAAAKSSEERFQDFHTKALSSSPVKLNDKTFKQITALPRDYTTMVLLTALDSKFGCQLCREFQPEWDILSRSWTKGDKKAESRMIFGTLDFADGRDTFMSVSNPNAQGALELASTSRQVG